MDQEEKDKLYRTIGDLYAKIEGLTNLVGQLATGITQTGQALDIVGSMNQNTLCLLLAVVHEHEHRDRLQPLFERFQRISSGAEPMPPVDEQSTDPEQIVLRLLGKLGGQKPH